jgi:hypothetical protein
VQSDSPSKPSDSRPVVFLHVGAPKTGTTFLQDVMWHHRDQLADDGVLFTRKRYGDHFQATLDLRQVKSLRTDNKAAQGAWDRVARRARKWPGTSVISHELFAAARPRQVRRALASLAPADVHIVYTARDLWRQLPAEWQESTKHGRKFSFDEFLTDVVDKGSAGVVGKWFWSVHDILDVLDRWGSDLPRDHVHVVTVPPSGADAGLLWRRFAGLVGIDAERYDTEVARSNASLGSAEVGLVRRVNAALGDQLPNKQRLRYVKDLLAQRILVAGPNRHKIIAPPDRYAWTHARAEEFIAGIRAGGYDVVGDLEELRPLAPPDEQTYLHPDDVPESEVISVAVEAIARLAMHMARMREEHMAGVARSAAKDAHWRLHSLLGIPARLAAKAKGTLRR